MRELDRGEVVAGRWRVLRRIKASPTQVCLVRDGDGYEGFLKYQEDRYPGRGPSYARKRFLREGQIMRDLVGEPGVIPVLDVDDDLEAHWFVTEKATFLTEHIGQEPDLREVVDAFAHLASTLARLKRERGITHRDLKPDNLFWLRGQALLGDFGIAGAPDPAELHLTEGGRKHGPWGYIAPEALNNESLRNWAPADVYSLAKCLWRLAMGKNYPPQGTLYIREDGTSLYPVGGKAGLELARLLEISTHQKPVMRPTMAVLRDELLVWLDQHPAGSIERPKATKFASFTGALRIQLLAEERGVDGIAADCVHKLLDPLRDRQAGSSSVAEDHTTKVAIPDDVVESITHGDPDWEREFDVTEALTWDDWPNIRVVAIAIGEHDDATYIAQWQSRTTRNAEWQPTSPTRTAKGTLWFPSDHSARMRFSDELANDDPDLR